MDLIDKIIKYEENIFKEFIEKRNKFIEHISNVKTDTMTKEQLNNFIHDVKMILEPIKTASENIDYIFTNTEFNKSNSINDLNDIQNILVFYSYYSNIINQNQIQN
jgi:hypothetical protein